MYDISIRSFITMRLHLEIIRKYVMTVDYKRNRRYFDTINWVVIGTLVIISIALLFFYIFVGIILLLATGSFLYFKLRDIPTDDEIDAVFEEQSRIVLDTGYQKLGLTQNEVNIMDPIVIHGPLIKNIRFSPAIKSGKDKIVRSSNHEVIAFYFGKDQVYVYYYSFSVIDNERNEVIDSYFYEDVISVSTSSTTTAYYDSSKKREEFVNLASINFNTYGPTSIQCAIQNLQRVEEKIYEMKNLLGEKKSAS